MANAISIMVNRALSMLIKQYREADRQEKLVKKAKQELYEELVARLDGAEEVVDADGLAILTYKQNKPTETVDWEKLAKQFDPEAKQRTWEDIARSFHPSEKQIKDVTESKPGAFRLLLK